VLNKLRGTFNLLAVKAPGSAIAASHAGGHRRVDGRHAITEELGRKLESVTIDDLGQAAKIQADKDNTTIVEGKGDLKASKAHRADQSRVENTTSDYDKEKLARAAGQVVGRRGHHPASARRPKPN